MTDTNRRRFLAAAGAGATAGAVALTIDTAHATGARRSADSAQETVVALVPDHRSDEVLLMVGEREVVVHDRDLALRLLNAAGGR